MSAYCPECETDLDGTTGICPACRWDPNATSGYRVVRTAHTPELSITERYRGTPYDASVQLDAFTDVPQGISRGRTFVIIGLIAGLIFYGAILTSMASL